MLPDADLPDDGESLRAQVREYLEQSDLVVQILGARYGPIPEGETASVGEIENELARARASENGLSRIVWWPRGLEVTDERQRSLMGLRLL